MMSLMNQSVITQSILIFTVLGLLALLASAVLAVIASRTGKGVAVVRGLSVVLLLGTLVPILLGFVGTAYGHHLLAQAMASASAEAQDTLQAAGQSIAMVDKMIGVCSSMVCMLPASLLCVYTAARRTASLNGDAPDVE